MGSSLELVDNPIRALPMSRTRCPDGIRRDRGGGQLLWSQVEPSKQLSVQCDDNSGC